MIFISGRLWDRTTGREKVTASFCIGTARQVTRCIHLERVALVTKIQVEKRDRLLVVSMKRSFGTTNHARPIVRGSGVLTISVKTANINKPSEQN